MSLDLFVTGMLRSGTTLVQTLLTNHPLMLVAYQPFHRLYVDVKQIFLEEAGISRALPLDDGAPSGSEERARFLEWLTRRHFDVTEKDRLAARAIGGKGSGLSEFGPLPATPGTFFQIRASLHEAMADRFRELGQPSSNVIGSKEILCEEYIPALIANGTRCVLVVRDLRAIIASANNGRYREQVGDRYPLMMLIRLWRKTAGYWLKFRDHPNVLSIRFEDLLARPENVLNNLAEWLGIEQFPTGIASRPLLDHFGCPWHGNSSFGDKAALDPAVANGWRQRLRMDEMRFVSACAMAELQAIGYSVPEDLEATDIISFDEDTTDVRTTYLQQHRIDDSVRRHESTRLALTTGHSSLSSELSGEYFLFPESFVGPGSG